MLEVGYKLPLLRAGGICLLSSKRAQASQNPCQTLKTSRKKKRQCPMYYNIVPCWDRCCIKWVTVSEVLLWRGWKNLYHHKVASSVYSTHFPLECLLMPVKSSWWFFCTISAMWMNFSTPICEHEKYRGTPSVSTCCSGSTALSGSCQYYRAQETPAGKLAYSARFFPFNASRWKS